MVGGVERSFGTSVPFLIILYTKKIKNQGVLRKKSNSRSYFLKFRSQAEFAPWQARFSILPLFYICLAKAWRCPDKKRRVNAWHGAREEKLSPSRRRGHSVVVFAWVILSTRSRRRAVRRSPVAGAAPPHFCPARAKSGSLR